MATFRWCSGAEHGTSELSANGGGMAIAILGTPQILTNPKKNGDYCFYFSVVNSTEAFTTPTLEGAYVQVISFYLYVTSLSGAQTNIVHGVSSLGGLSIKSSGSGYKIQATKGTSFDGNESAELSFGTYYLIDLKCDTTTATMYIDFQVNGTAATQSSWSHAILTDQSFHFGPCDSTSTIFAMDDIVIMADSDCYPIGEHIVAGLRPDQQQEWTSTMADQDDTAIGISHYAWDHLDDNPWPDCDVQTGEYVKKTASDSTFCSSYFEDVPTNVDVLGVTGMLAYSSSAKQANNGACTITSNTLVTTLWGSPGSLVDYSDNGEWYYKSARVLPYGGSGWTPALVNALITKFGYSTDISPEPWWGNIILEAAYVETGVELVVAECGHAHAADGDLALTQHNELAVNESGHGHTVDEPVLVPMLVVAECSHTLIDDGPLTVVYHQAEVELVVAECGHEHSAEGPLDLVQHNVLDPAESSHAHSCDGPLGLGVDISEVQEALHGHTADGDLVLVQHYVLPDVAESSHAHDADGDLALVQHNILDPAETGHDHSGEGDLTLVQHNVLAVGESGHTHEAEGDLLLTQHNVLSMDESGHAHDAEGPIALTQHNILSVDESGHAHDTEGNLVLVQHNVIDPAECGHAHDAEGPLTVVYHPPGAETLVVQESNHAHTVDGDLILTQHNILAVQETSHEHSAEGDLSLVQHNVLAVQESSHDHTADVITLVVMLVVADCWHEHTAEGIDMVQTLTVADSFHYHWADGLGMFPGGAAIDNMAGLWGFLFSKYTIGHTRKGGKHGGKVTQARRRRKVR